MLKGIVCSVPNLFVLMLRIRVVYSQLLPDQVRVMTSIYNIFQNNTGSSFVWQTVEKTPNPCSWKGVSCNSGNSSINHLSFSKFSISTSEFLPILCSITSLESLDVSNNRITSVPDQFYSDCGQLTELKLLNFSANELNDFLPTFNGFSELQTLNLSKNSLGGEIESELDELGSLKSVDLSWNRFRGIVPTSLGKMNLLEEIRFSGNAFTGEIGKLITKYRNLSVIDLSGNSLSGSIPQELGELTRLEILVLSLNSLTGEIPSSLSNIITLKIFAANQNQFIGSIPPGITSYVGTLDLSYNSLTGAIPSDLLSGSNLQSLDLSYNRLQGPIPARISTRLFRLRLGSNFLNGLIPSFENLGELMYLELDNNGLSGEIPSGLGRCRNLTLLNLAHNRLTGMLPSVLGDLTNLVVLSLEFNDFVGRIPQQISQLSKLEMLNLSLTGLNGSIPRSISSLKMLSSLDLRGNNLSGSIPESIGNLPSLLELQLGRNQLSGRIPAMPPKLQIALNLSSNLFGGRIPLILSRLDSLEVLDLSNNKFTGEIPVFLTDLLSLTHLLLSDNELTGVVPMFNDHVALDIKGNSVTFPSGGIRPPSPQKRSKRIYTAIGIAFASAAAAAALLTVIVISISRKLNRIHVNLLTPHAINVSDLDFEKVVGCMCIKLKTRFSTYYKAAMPSGTTYFVKKVNRSDKMFRLHGDKRFGEELEDLAKLCNSNVMIPLAYVLTGRSAFLFYDFAPEGTLSDALHGTLQSAALDWASRYNIAVGVSQGLAYLHEHESGPILLLDLSSNTILLKSLNEPRIGDIELCKVIHPSKSTGSISAVAGSAGYVPPEYAYTMRVTARGNVYSLGVLLLELVTGKPAVSEGIELAKLVLSISEQWEDILDVIVSKTSAAVTSHMLSVLQVALACVSIVPETRPNSFSVLQMLMNTSTCNGNGESSASL